MTADTPLHDVIAAAFVRTRESLRPLEHKHADKRLTDWLEAFEDDLSAVARPVLAKHLTDERLSPEVRDALNAALNPEHASAITPLIAVVGALFYPLVSALMSGEAALLGSQSLADVVSSSHTLPLSPAEVALGKIKNTLGTIDFYREMARSGLDSTHADVMLLNTGEPISVGDALLLYRRGQLGDALGMSDDDALAHVIRQSRVRDEYIKAITDLRYAPVSASLAVEAALKGHLTDAEAAHRVGVAGIDPAEYPWMRQTAGRPPGTQQMLELRNRGQATTQDVTDAVRQSDINDHYLPFILHLGEYHPPVRSIMAMLRSGAIDDTKATELFKNQGVLDTDIPGYLAEAHHGRTATVKNLSQSQIVRMFLDGLITQTQAHDRLVALGYQSGDVDLLLAMADDTKRERYATAVVTRIHTLYVAHKLDAPAASAALGKDGIQATTINELLTLWDIERAANVHAPTVPMVGHAYRQAVIGPAETKTRLLALGVQPADLAIVVANFYSPTTPRATVTAAIDAIEHA